MNCKNLFIEIKLEEFLCDSGVLKSCENHDKLIKKYAANKCPTKMRNVSAEENIKKNKK